MAKFYDDGYGVEFTSRDSGVTSFYGVHRYSVIALEPKASFGAPINDLYGRHLIYGSTESMDEISDED